MKFLPNEGANEFTLRRRENRIQIQIGRADRHCDLPLTGFSVIAGRACGT